MAVHFRFEADSREVDGAGQLCAVEFEATQWDEILPYFMDFLLGCGYRFPADAEFVLDTPVDLDGEELEAELFDPGRRG